MLNNIPLPPKTDEELETNFLLDKYLSSHRRNNPKVLLFIDEFMRCRNVDQASKYAGLTPSAGKSLRRKRDVTEAINELTRKANLKFGYDAEEVVERVHEIMNANLAHLQKPNGQFHESLTSLPPELQRAIKKFKVKNEYELDPNGQPTFVKATVIEVELNDKLRASELLGQEKNIFKKTTVIQHDITSNMKDILLQSEKRALERSVTPQAIPIPYKDVTND